MSWPCPLHSESDASMTEPAATAEHVAAVRSPDVRRSLLVVAATAGLMLVGDWVVGYITVVGMFNPLFLLGIPAAIVIVALMTAALAREMTGSAHLVGAFAVSFLLAGIGAWAFLTGRLQPMSMDPIIWAHVLVCVLCSLAFGLFLGPVLLRWLGAAAVVGLLVFTALLPTAAQRAQQQAAAGETLRREEGLSSYMESEIFPMVTDLAGWANVKAGFDGASWIVNQDGAVVFVWVQAVEDAEGIDQYACSHIRRDGDTDAESWGDLPDWCSATEAGWARANGTGRAFVTDGRLVVLNSGGPLGAGEVGGSRLATSDEVADLAEHLRPMTTSEVQKYLVPHFVPGDTLPIDTPGL